MSEVNEKNGTVISKEEKVKRDSTEKYWKFSIRVDGDRTDTSMSLWEYEAGNDVSIGDRVKIYWTEKKGTGKFGPVMYRNINSISLLEGSDDKQSLNEAKKVGGEGSGATAPPPNPAVIGMCSNQAMQWLIHKNLGYQENFSKTFDVIWKENEKKRKELLG